MKDVIYPLQDTWQMKQGGEHMMKMPTCSNMNQPPKTDHPKPHFHDGLSNTSWTKYNAENRSFSEVGKHVFLKVLVQAQLHPSNRLLFPSPLLTFDSWLLNWGVHQNSHNYYPLRAKKIVNVIICSARIYDVRVVNAHNWCRDEETVPGAFHARPYFEIL